MTVYKNTQRGIVPIVVAIVALIAIAGGGAVYYKAKQNNELKLASGDNSGKTAEFMLYEQNNSGQSGTVSIKDTDGKAKVTIDISRATTTPTRQPAHIHVNSCADIGAVRYPLSDVVNGNSVTMLDVSVEELFAEPSLSVNVHQSAEQSNTYVACGDLASTTIGTKNSVKNKNDVSADSKASVKVNGAVGNTSVNASVNANINAKADDLLGNDGPTTYTITYTDSGFSPNSIEIKKGEKVTFINQSSGRMDVSSDPHPLHTNYLAFNQNFNFEAGSIWSFVFTNTGSWGYHNHLNTSHRGTVIVK